jgi:hypothetical protein
MNGRDGIPSMLTVEEAANFMRIGRTKAYALAQEWRATDGQSGLPVVDFGHVLRVPRCQLEAMIGGPLDSIIEDGTVETATPTVEVSPPPEVVLPASVEPEVVTSEPVAAEQPARLARPRTRRATSRDHAATSTQLSFSELQLND